MVPLLFKFYIQSVLKLKKNNSGPKRLKKVVKMYKMLCQIKKSDGDHVLDFLNKLISVSNVLLFFLHSLFKICIRFSSLSFKAKPELCIFNIYLINIFNTAWFKKINSISCVYISWFIHGIWMIYITFEREDPKFLNTTTRALI